MKILILTSRFGMGHYCAAEAIKEGLIATNSDDIIDSVDIIEILNPIIYKFIYSFFNIFICRFSSVYNLINSFFTKYENNCLKRKRINKINCLIKKYSPDLIVSTWSASSRYISVYKKEYEDNIPLYTCITDITVHDGWITDMTNMYFVATKSTMESLVFRGVDSDKIIVNGIPVRQVFKQGLQLNSFDDNYELKNDKKEILIMGGGLGLIPDINNVLDRLYDKGTVNITIITGKNKKKLKKLKADYPKIDVVGYTDQVYRYMKKSDLLITKPGGISTFEAIYTTIPLYVIKPLLSQEVGNAEFIERIGIGKVAWKNDFDISEDILSLINNEEAMKEMKNNMKLLRREVSQLKVKKIYERSMKRYVGYNTFNNYSININNIWSNSDVIIQKAE